MSSAKKFDLVTELHKRIESAETDKEAALYLAEHHRCEVVQLRQQVEELKAEIAELEVRLKDATDMLSAAQSQCLDLEQEIDGLSEHEGSN